MLFFAHIHSSIRALLPACRQLLMAAACVRSDSSNSLCGKQHTSLPEQSIEACKTVQRLRMAGRQGCLVLPSDACRPRRLLVFVNPFGGKGAGQTWQKIAAPVLAAAGVRCQVIETWHQVILPSDRDLASGVMRALQQLRLCCVCSCCLCLVGCESVCFLIAVSSSTGRVQAAGQMQAGHHQGQTVQATISFAISSPCCCCGLLLVLAVAGSCGECAARAEPGAAAGA